jgi:hypothetical protein
LENTTTVNRVQQPAASPKGRVKRFFKKNKKKFFALRFAANFLKSPEGLYLSPGIGMIDT